MNGAHAHILLNHLPVVGLVFSVALLGAAVYVKNDTLGRAGLVALVAIAIVTVPVYLTGEPAEEVVEGFGFVTDDLIEPHEEAGRILFITLEAIGVIALLGLMVSRAKALPRWLVPTVLVMNLIAAGWAGYTAYLGGQIVHEEARPDFLGSRERHGESEH